jgi:phosphoribosylamine--glycine ligase
MNILLLGSGGREDALAWRLRQSPSCDALLAAPGNPGIARWAECVAADACDADAMVALASTRQINLIVVGPEAPLVAGVSDGLRAAGFAVFGPSAAAAQLEGSKGFTKDLCRANGIPTAAYVRVDRQADAYASLEQFGCPVVIKADGLAAGKGVTVAMTRREAEAAIAAAGDGPMVIEEYLEGEEASLFALVDGEVAVPLASAQDHKRVGEGDTGPNTGGMGAYSPAPVLTEELQRRAMEEIVRPTARAMAAAGTPFSGVLYAGLMLTSDGPKLIEYNVRFGDPECEAIMPLIDGDFAELLMAVASGQLAEARPSVRSDKHAVTVIVAARGYPGTPAAGGTIRALETAETVEGVTVFHAGTARTSDGLVAKGGRVLAVTAVADTFANARARAYRAVDQIDFADGFCRRDIGWRELARAERQPQEQQA